jgi:DNA-binding transcriptional LysR family regulator
VLTPEAVVIAEWADRLLRVAADVDTGLAALHPERRPKLRLASSTTVAEQLLPGWLATYQNGQRPGRSASVALTVTGTDQVVDDVRAGRADLGFVEGIAGPRGLRSRVVATDDLCLVVGPGHAWARRGRAVTAAELRRTPLVVRAADGGQPLADAVPPAAELTTTSAVRAAVVDGAGPALMSRLAVADDLTAQRLREIRVTGLDLRRELRAVWAGTGRTPASPAAADLLAHVPAPATRG